MDAIHKTDDLKIPINDLLIDMVARVWYPVIFFKVNFGWQDQLANVVLKVKEVSKLKDDANDEEIKKAIKAHQENPEVRQALKNLSLFVPYRLIRPWVTEQIGKVKDSQINHEIARLAKAQFVDRKTAPPYYLLEDSLFLNLQWVAYVKENYKVLVDFGYWHLLEYLQKRNPNVPGLVSKLFRPGSRALGPARTYWREFILAQPDFKCIFSGKQLNPKGFAVDHFLPWSFVAHDQLWNLLPIDKSANSSKSNNLPAVDAYLHDFARVQRDFFQFNYTHEHVKRLEDFSLFFKEKPAEISLWDENSFFERMKSGILPQHEIALNMGFQKGWKYTP